MIGKIVFTVITFILFIYIFLLKLIKKNDTTYINILAIQAFGILLNLLKISFEIFNRYVAYNYYIYMLYYYTCCSNYTRIKEY